MAQSNPTAPRLNPPVARDADPARRASHAAPTEKVSGPVPMSHRNKLGQDILADPQGAGMPGGVGAHKRLVW